MTPRRQPSAAGKTLAGTATAAGSAGCVGALGAALPVAMVVLAGWGIWAAIKSAKVVADLARISGEWVCRVGL